MMRLLIILILFNLQAKAVTYYISTSGNSTNSGTSTAAPWSMDKLNASQATLQPGDFVLFKRGEIFFGTLKITKSGTFSGGRITYGAYGTGAKPVITGALNVTVWTQISGAPNGAGVYESTQAISTLAYCYAVSVNGIAANRGRFPNFGTAYGGWDSIASYTNKSTLTGKKLPSSSTVNLTGAKAVIRTSRFSIDSVTIASHSNQTITFVNGGTTLYSSTPMRTNWGYLITDHPSLLDVHGEWYYDKVTKKIRVYLNGSPSSHVVMAAVRDYTIDMRSAAYITLKDLRIEGSNIYGVWTQGAQFPIIESCDFQHHGGIALKANQSGSQVTNPIFRNNTFFDCHNMGIDIRGEGGGATVTGTIFRRIGIFTEVGGFTTGETRSALVTASGGDGHYYADNVIDTVGGAGIRFSGSNVTVTRNRISNFCYVFDDNGGIYCYKSGGTNRRITRNIVFNGSPRSMFGANTTNNPNNEGIYIDDNSREITIDSNIVYNIGSRGIYLHNSQNITVRNNTVFNCGAAAIGWLRNDSDPEKPNLQMAGIQMKRNIFMTTNTSSRVAQFWLDLGNVDSLKLIDEPHFPTSNSRNGIDSNYYLRPLQDDTTIIHSRAPKLTNFINSVMGWAARTGHDWNSKLTPKKFSATAKADTAFALYYNPTGVDSTITLTKSWMKHDGTIVYKGSYTMPAYSSHVMLSHYAEAPVIENPGAPAPIYVPGPRVPIKSKNNSKVIQLTNGKLILAPI